MLKKYGSLKDCEDVRLKFYTNFSERCFLNGCALVYLANYIKLLRTAAFDFINYKLLIL